MSVYGSTGPFVVYFANWSDANIIEPTWSLWFCRRAGRFNTNFLGQRNVVCDGTKFSKEPKGARR